MSLPVAAALVLSELSESIPLDPKQFLGIPVALVGAAFLAFGAQFQSRGLIKVEKITGEKAGAGLSFQHILNMFRRPSWVIGTLLLGLAVVFQIGSLSLSPLIVVQPLGVVALVITSVLNAKMTGVRVNRRTRASISMCVAGVFAFVLIAAFTAADRPVTDGKLLTILILFGVLLALCLVLFVAFRKRAVALVYIIGAGTIYGFVATLAKSVIARLQHGDLTWLTWVSVAALVTGTVLGMIFVQNAYSSGPPDLVVAGLTVVDPLIAVLIGIVVLNEAAQAPLWAILGFIVSGLVAIFGVIGLAKYHPQVADAR